MIAGHDGYLRDHRRVSLYGYQKEWRDDFFRGIYVRDHNDSYLEIARQAGKTLGVVESVAFLLGTMDMVMGRPVNIGFFAPRYEQARTDWIRVKEIMGDVAAIFGLVVNEENASTMMYMRPLHRQDNGAFIRWQRSSTMHFFSLGETVKLESKTLDIAIIEEAHEVNDQKVNKEVLPMLTSTNGFTAYIGVAGYRLCDFKRGVEESGHSFVVPVSKVLEQRKKTYEETGDPAHLEYEKFYVSTLEKVGNIATDEIRTQYLLEWVTERGNFITRESLHKCKRKFLCVSDPDVTVGIDFGKHTDSTVVTVSTALGQRLKSMEMLGSNYTAQVPALLSWLQTEFADKGWNIGMIRPDSTGAGDVVCEMLKEKSRWNVKPFIFSSPSKAELFHKFTNLMAMAEGIADGSVKDEGQRRFEYWEGDKNIRKFEQEMVDMEREYVGDKQLLSCHHPDKSGAHDDYVDSAALSVSYERARVSFETL